MRPRLLVALAVLAMALGAGAFLAFQPAPPPAAASAAIGGPFQLNDQRGRPVSDADLKGKPVLVFFGFTYCPEVCPTTLARLTGWMRALGPQADRLNVVFVTVDPERDTAKAMADYLQPFDPRIRGLTGPPDRIAAVEREYRVYARKVPLADGGYTMDHSAGIYAFDRRGAFVQLLNYQEPDAAALETIRQLLAS